MASRMPLGGQQRRVPICRTDRKECRVNIARFEHLTRTISTMLSRRAIAGTLGLGALNLPGLVEAKKKRKKKKKIKKNQFGCVDVGKFCTDDGQCCSGICQGKKPKKGREISAAV
jgi:hypothetical protein